MMCALAGAGTWLIIATYLEVPGSSNLGGAGLSNSREAWGDSRVERIWSGMK